MKEHPPSERIGNSSAQGTTDLKSGFAFGWTRSRRRPSDSTNVSSSLSALAARVVLEFTGDALQYQISRTESGWVVELVNNSGVIKRPDHPAARHPPRELG